MIIALSHLLTFGLYPILFLYFHNIDKVGLSSLTTTLFPTLTIAALITLFINKKLNNLNKSACLVSIFLFLFFLYGHIAAFAPTFLYLTPLGPITKHFIVIPLWLISTLSILKVVAKAKTATTLTTALSYIGFFLVISSLLTALPNLIRSNTQLDRSNQELYNRDLPDIYHIVLDGYARQDTLLETYGFDNSNFANKLRDMGFFIIDKSRSNYVQTYLSMASTFNMDYVNELQSSLGSESDNITPLTKMIADGEAIKQLRKHGYKIINLNSGWAGSESLKPDLRITNDWDVREFESALLGTTPIIYFAGEDLRFAIHISNIRKSFNTLPKITSIDNPTFTYAHVMSPHPPFVFDKYGNGIKQNTEFGINDLNWKPYYGRTTKMYKESYIEQLQFINKLTLSSLRKIINNSPKKPIIILQSDHGPASNYSNFIPSEQYPIERTANLLAYYIPPTGQTETSPPTTPVNIYRYIFNTFFSTNYPLLDNKIYFSLFEKPYDFKDVTDEINKEDAKQ